MRAAKEIQSLTDKLNKGDIHVDEPLFCLRARDVTMSIIVRLWASVAGTFGAPTRKVMEAENLADLADEWPVRQIPGQTHTLGPVADKARARRAAPVAHAMAAILKERIIQQGRWDASHDDSHVDGKLAIIAAELLLSGTSYENCGLADEWGLKEKNPRRLDQLTIAGALVLAEMERVARLPVIVSDADQLITELGGNPSTLGSIKHYAGAAFAALMKMHGERTPDGFKCGTTFQVQRKKVVLEGRALEYPFDLDLLHSEWAAMLVKAGIKSRYFEMASPESVKYVR